MRNLGKVIGLFLFVLCAFQANAQKTLEQYVAEEAAQCPKDMGNGVVAQEVSFDGEDVDYVMTVTDEIYSNFVNVGANQIKEMMIEALKSDPMIAEVIKRDVSVGMIFVRESDGEGIPIIITANDFKGALYGKDLNYYITYTQERCPAEMADGITLLDCELDDGVLVYILQCTETVFNALDAAGEETLTQNVTHELRKQYEAGEEMTKFVVDAGITIAYGYTDGDKEIAIAIPAELIK